MAGRLAIEGRSDAESAGVAAVEIAVVVDNAGGYAQRAEQRVVKLFWGFEVVDTNHDVTEHGISPLSARY